MRAGGKAQGRVIRQRNKKEGCRAAGARGCERRDRCGTRQTGRRVETILGFGFISQLPGKHNTVLTPSPACAAGNPRGSRGMGCPQLGTSKSLYANSWELRFGAEPFLGGGEGRSGPALGTRAHGTCWNRRSTLLLILIFALCFSTKSSTHTRPAVPGTTGSSRPPTPARGTARGRPLRALVIKARRLQPTADSRCVLRGRGPAT